MGKKQELGPMGAKIRRPTKDEYYLNLAEQVAQRSTCLRRHFGAGFPGDRIRIVIERGAR